MFHDLRYALRTLRHNPGFAAVAIISLALGIGANAAIFSLADYVLLRPLPVPNSSRLLVVWSQFRGENITGFINFSNVSYPDFDDLRKKSNSFAGPRLPVSARPTFSRPASIPLWLGTRRSRRNSSSGDCWTRRGLSLA
jgi:hypothetical protein